MIEERRKQLEARLEKLSSNLGSSSHEQAAGIQKTAIRLGTVD